MRSPTQKLYGLSSCGAKAYTFKWLPRRSSNRMPVNDPEDHAYHRGWQSSDGKTFNNAVRALIPLAEKFPQSVHFEQIYSGSADEGIEAVSFRERGRLRPIMCNHAGGLAASPGRGRPRFGPGLIFIRQPGPRPGRPVDSVAKA